MHVGPKKTSFPIQSTIAQDVLYVFSFFNWIHFYSRKNLCIEMAKEWAQDVTNHVARFSLPYQSPKVLPNMEIQIEDEEDEVRKYSEGKLHHLNRFTTNVTDVEMVTLNNITYYLVDISVDFRLLRTTYLWQNYFKNGLLSMYHTCGVSLPLTIFDVSKKRKTN